ncbi:hypothetical protein RhiJN_22913 [Ceratobasidium sp. AG-Ba]|nr:hypothetical protein RhiJN_22913 [Ceratobasidium sp. AG-Ba]
MAHNAYGQLGSPAYFKGPRGPPQPLGCEARQFPISAATSLPLSADSHSSGISIRAKLNGSGRSTRPFRTGELVGGRVHIYAPSQDSISSVARLSLRVYFESRTLFWSLELASPDSKIGQQLQKIKGTASKKFENVIRHEVHRGLVPHSAVTLSWSPNAPLDLSFEPNNSPTNNTFEAILPFSFVIPRSMTVTEYSRMTNAPRELCPIERCPPPTFRDCRDGSVQWVTEAILTLQPGSPPVNDDTMLRQSTDSEIVTRLVFPVLPALEDVGVLRNRPYFGDDPITKLHGCRLLSQEEQDQGGKSSTLNRVRERGGHWEAYARKLGYSSSRFIASEIYINAGARVSTSAPNIRLFAYLKVEVTNTKPMASFFRSPKSRVISVQRAVVSLYRVSSTRGGKEIRPHISELLLRQHEHRFESTESSSTSTGLLVPSGDNVDPIELDLTIDLQDETEIRDKGGEQIAAAARNYIPSFRTPNIQHEYLLTISFWFSGDEFENTAARIPIQFVPGDEDELPTFADALDMTEEQPPAFGVVNT